MMPPKPTALPPLPANIPPELIAVPHWVIWKYRWRGGANGKPGKWTKPPLDTVGRLAKSTDPSTWTSYENAIAAAKFAAGIGFVLTADLGIIAIDFDNCYDPNTREFVPRVAAAVLAINSYTEFSPSGRGLRVLCRGTLPKMWLVRDWVELYNQERFVTITGHALADLPGTINEAQDAIDGLIQEIGGDRPATTPTIASRPISPLLITLSDREVIELCRRASNGRKFSRLYDHGELTDYGGDHSRADAALVAMIQFYTQDEDQIDRLMRGSALCRGKWEGRPKYRAATIALSESGEHWTPPRRSGRFTVRGGRVVPR